MQSGRATRPGLPESATEPGWYRIVGQSTSGTPTACCPRVNPLEGERGGCCQHPRSMSARGRTPLDVPRLPERASPELGRAIRRSAPQPADATGRRETRNQLAGDKGNEVMLHTGFSNSRRQIGQDHRKSISRVSPRVSRSLSKTLGLLNSCPPHFAKRRKLENAGDRRGKTDSQTSALVLQTSNQTSNPLSSVGGASRERGTWRMLPASARTLAASATEKSASPIGRTPVVHR